MASADPHVRRPAGRIISLYHLDVHVEARRCGAAALDLLILLVLQTWINDVFGVTQPSSGRFPFQPVIAGYGYLTSATTVALPWLIVLVVVYFTVQEALFGATWGKAVAGLRVVTTDGLRPSLRAVLIRNLLRPIDYWPIFYAVGGVSALFSPRRQRLGDRAAGTVVVRAETAVLAYRTPAELRHRLLWLGAAIALCVAGCFAFSYYGRPPLVIQGLINTGGLGNGNLAVYSLGAPRWGRNSVTYPLSYRTAHDLKACAGDVTLSWHGFFDLDGGWRLDGAAITCR